jgi:hypothetical protein
MIERFWRNAYHLKDGRILFGSGSWNQKITCEEIGENVLKDLAASYELYSLYDKGYTVVGSEIQKVEQVLWPVKDNLYNDE